jgi:hypothetical protein
MWEDLAAGLCVLGFTAVITVLLIELPAVLDWPPIVADQLRGGRRRGCGAVPVQTKARLPGIPKAFRKE